MNVLFIKSQIGTGSSDFFDMAIGALSASLLQSGHKTHYFQIENEDSMPALFRCIETFKPDIVGFSTTEASIDSARVAAKIIKKKFPEIFIIFGGVNVTISPDPVVADKSVDAVSRGEADFSLPEFVKRFSKKDGSHLYTKGFWVRNGKSIIKNPPADKITDLNTLPEPDREIFARVGRLFSSENMFTGMRSLEFTFSRGCPYQCAYCSNHALGKYFGNGYIRVRNPHKAITEILNVQKKYKPDALMFYDDIFTLNKKWLKSFLKEYQQKIRLPFTCNIRIEACDKKTYRELKKAGCYMVLIGLESGDEVIRKMVMKRNMTNQQLIEAFGDARESGLKTFSFVMVGLPDETPSNYLNTINLMAKIQPDEYNYFVFFPYNGTNIYDYAKGKGYLSQKGGQFIERRNTMLSMPGFKPKDIEYYGRHDVFRTLIFHRITRHNWHSKIYHKIMFWLHWQRPSLLWYPLVSVLIVLLREIKRWFPKQHSLLIKDSY